MVQLDRVWGRDSIRMTHAQVETQVIRAIMLYQCTSETRIHGIDHGFGALSRGPLSVTVIPLILQLKSDSKDAANEAPSITRRARLATKHQRQHHTQCCNGHQTRSIKSTEHSLCLDSPASSQPARALY